MKYTILALLVYLIASYVELSVLPNEWSIITRIASVALVLTGVFFIDKRRVK